MVDFNLFNITIQCISLFPLDKRFQELWTNEKYREVQKQIMGMLDCVPVLQQKKNDVILTYLIESKVQVDDFIKKVTYLVEFNDAESDAKCSCALFEIGEILCWNILVIFNINWVHALPDKFILDR